MSIRIIADSSTDMISKVRCRVDVLPLSITFDDDEYIDGVDIDHETFYKRLMNEKTLPKTSQAAPAAFAEKYEQAKTAGDDVVVITISSGLSGTYQSAVMAAREYDNVHVIDSRNVTIAAGILVQRAVELVDSGLTAAQVAEQLEGERDNIRLIAMVDSLEYLKRGGRISKTVAFAGGLLNIKPIICMKDGVLEVTGKSRGAKAAFNTLKKNIAEAGGVDFERPILLGYTGLDDSLLRRFINESLDMWGGDAKTVPTSIVGSVVGTHAGPGAVAVAFYTK